MIKPTHLEKVLHFIFWTTISGLVMGILLEYGIYE